MELGSTTSRINKDPQYLVQLVGRMRRGELEAAEVLVSSVYERLVCLSRKMLRSSSAVVQRWEQTEDLAHASWIRIQRALQDDTLKLQDDMHFFRLAAKHIRFELIDMYRKHSGANGLAANYQSARLASNDSQQLNDGERFSANITGEPSRLAAWGEFHRLVEELPEQEKTIVDLLWYQGLTQQAAAKLLGVDVKTVKRRWRDIKINLADKLDGGLINADA